MASFVSNQNVRRFESGGLVVVTDGVDDFTVANLKPSSLSWTNSLPRRIEYNDRGPVQVPLEGDDSGCDFELTLRMGSFLAANHSLWALLDGRNAAANTARTFDKLQVKIRNHQTAAAGENVQFTDFWLSAPLSWKSGDDFDEVVIKGRCAASPVVEAY